MAADIKGLAISTGSACASGSSELSPVLLAMGLEKNVVENSVRISLGVSNTREEIDNTIEIISNILKPVAIKTGWFHPLNFRNWSCLTFWFGLRSATCLFQLASSSRPPFLWTELIGLVGRQLNCRFHS